MEVAMGMRRLVWSLSENLRSYGAAISELRRRAEGSIVLDRANNVNYRFDDFFQALCVSNDELDIPVCPYPECTKPSGNGYMCIHLESEIENVKIAREESTIGPSDMDTIVTSEEIKRALNLAAAHSMSDRMTITGNLEFVQKIGVNPFISDDCEFIVALWSQKSTSLLLTRKNLKAQVLTCFKAGCNIPADYDLKSDHACFVHYQELQVSKAPKEKFSTLKEETFDSILGILGRNKAKTNQAWVSILKFLYVKGESGFTHAGTKGIFFIAVTEQLGLYYRYVNSGKSASNIYICVHPWCGKRLKENKFFGAMEDRAKLVCQGHSLAGSGIDIGDIIDGLVYGGESMSVVLADAITDKSTRICYYYDKAQEEQGTTKKRNEKRKK